MKIVLTGGGTGGHVYPAVSVGQALRQGESGAGVELLFVGSSHGPEGKIAQGAGIDFRAVPSAPLTKSVSLKNAAALMKLAAGVPRARGILKAFRPDVVIGTGGYTTAAVLLAARTLGYPIVIHEQNAVPGRTNTWLARIADKVCVSVEGSGKYFPAEKIVFTGMPVRGEFANLPDKALARRELGLLEDAFTVLVVGGSQGARKLNELVWEMWPMIDDGAVQVLHQVGERNFEEMRARNQAGPRERYSIRAYLDMPPAITSADLVIGRSGASTIAEITAAGRPSILVPYPFAYADHQKFNAKVLAERNAAIMVEESAASAQRLAETVRELRSSPEKLAAMASASKSLGMPDAAASVAEVAMGLVRYPVRPDLQSGP